jgi:hypothetical protein
LKKTIVILFLCLNTLLSVFAGGKKEVDERQAKNLDSWEETFDISEKKAGKYNIMVTASDQGGNTAVAGPYNLYIDPDSDLPIAGITNPLIEQRVPGNLNIVGTCIDDDGVSQVEIVFDGDSEHPKQAVGKEFWSYYLDTTKMTEGPHTIEVYGVDINGLQGHSTSVTWNLDRKMPVTDITSHGIGELVSGTLHLTGTVFDGNTISQLWYSINNGETFQELPIKYDKKNIIWTFDLSLNTKEIKDGPKVCWFKALDGQGTYGLYSFLFFIDNTAPEVQFLYPKADIAVNGEFAIAGVARDTVAMQSLEWKAGDKTGVFDLIPGNPYWSTTFDARTMGGKNVEISIIAGDTAGNKTVVKRRIPFDFEADKPTVIIDQPKPNEQVYDSLYLCGSVFDDDDVASVIYSLDGGSEKTIKTDRVFSEQVIAQGTALSAGSHTLSVRGVDVYGQEGNPEKISILAMGESPAFDEVSIIPVQKNADSIEYSYGMTINPESGDVIKTTVTAKCGIKHVDWKFRDGETVSIDPKKPEEAIALEIPTNTAPWGVTFVEIHAIDIYERETIKTLLFNILDLTKIHAEPSVIFTDSNIKDSVVDFTQGIPITGFFTGGTAVSAEIVPSTNFVNVKLDNNCIILTPGSNKGTSKPFVVRITTDKGLTYDSRLLSAKTLSEKAVLVLNNKKVFDGTDEVIIKGSVKADSSIKSTQYRLLTSYMIGDDGKKKASSTADTPFSPVIVDAQSGEFSIEYKANEVPEGISIVEVVTETTEGNKTVDAAFIECVPFMPEPEEGKKAITPPKPQFDWIEGENLYYTCIYRATYSANELLINNENANTTFFAQGGVIKKEALSVGENTVSASISYGDGKTEKSSYKYTKNGVSTIQFQSVDKQTYASGMKVVVPFISDKNESPVLEALVSSPYKITKAIATINDKSVVTKIIASDKNNEYFVTVPLDKISSGIATVTIVVNISNHDSIEAKGSLSIVRAIPESGIENTEKVYWFGTEEFPKTDKGVVLLKKDELYRGYANLSGPVKVRLEPPVEGLDAIVDGKSVLIKAISDGFYNAVQLIATDRDGFEYKAPLFDVVVDSANPSLSIINPTSGMWVQNSTNILVSADDANTILKVSFSVDNEKTWVALNKIKDKNSNNYSATIDLTQYSDGIIQLSVKALDIAGRQTLKRLVLAKDTKPPVASVIVPPVGDTINGVTTIVLGTKDDGKIVSATSFVGVLSQEKNKDSNSVASVNPENLQFEPIIKNAIGTKERALADNMKYTFTDAAGNVGILNKYDFAIDKESDKPTVEIHVPERNAVITSDFVVSGVIYDDDGPCKVWYAVDDDGLQDTSEFTELDGFSNSYSIKIPLASLTDNEHWVTVFAKDAYGVRGDPESLPFRVSLEEPKATVLKPAVGVTVRDFTAISGTASDKNGIEKVQISVDNGNTYNDATGTEEWTYTYDTHLMQDGTHVVFVRVYDKYGIVGLYSTLINIDNTNPDLQLELPLDGSISTGNVFFSGQTIDNIGLTNLSVSINALGNGTSSVPDNLAHIELVPDDIIAQVVDISKLKDGFYNIELTGSDAAGNISRVSRNIQLDTSKPATVADLMYPMNGEHVQGMFNMYGRAKSESPIMQVILFIDGKMLSETKLSDSGYFKFSLTPEQLVTGEHIALVKVITEAGESIDSNVQHFNYMATGPWISIDNFCMGDFAFDRPFLEGTTGYVLTERDVVILENKDATKEEKTSVAAKKVDKVELSFDNGKTFEKVGNSERWHYRIENEDMTEGYHFLIARTTMKNGEVTVTRSIIQIDKTAPSIKLISPGIGGHYNQELRFAGLSSDDIKLDSVNMALRSGDKSSYAIPSFIQGLYLDAHFFGATLYDIGVGLTFFDDNVKLQGQFGQLTQSQYEMMTGSSEELRYGGDVIGGKLIANIGYIPFRYFFGPDWAWLSATFGVGANFSYFSDTQSGKGQMLSAVLGQIEFPRVTIPKQKYLSTISFYTEGQVWFIPTDVESSEDIDSIVPQISCGLRVNIF